MPSLVPLLSPNSSMPSSTPVSSKKAPKKLRRKNPPPSLNTNHQKLPSSAGSSTYDLPKSRPSSSKSSRSLNNGNGWFASPPTPHPTTSTNGRRKSESQVDWSPEEFPFRPPPLPISVNGMMTPPESGSPNLAHRKSQGLQEQHHNPSLSGSSAYNSPLALSKQDNSPIKQTLISPPPKMVRGKGKDAFKAFSYDSYNNMPVSPPPQSPPPNSIPPTYLGTAQYPNNLLQQPTTPKRVQSFPTPLNTNLVPPTPAQLSLMGRTPNGSPILPPLPSFQSGGFGFDLPNTNTNNQFAQPKLSPTYPGRQRYKPVSAPLPSPEAPPVPQRRRPTVFVELETQSPVLDSPLVDSPLVQSPGDYIFHALTAEEPIILPSSAEQTPEPSPPTTSAEFTQPPTKGRARRKSDAVSSFLGGWKLAMMGGSNAATTSSNDKAASSSESDAPPVGVGDGGGWIHRRKGSFSSTRPPSREKSKHNAYAQEYKEFRAQKQAESVSSKRSSASSKEGSPATSPVDGTGVSAILGNLSTRERFGEKMKAAEGRQTKRESDSETKAKAQHVNVHPAGVEPATIEASEVVSLDVAVRQMKLLEEQLKKRRPLSPPDSRDGEKPAPVGSGESDKGYHAGSEYSLTNTTASTPLNSRQNSAQNSGTSSPAGSINQKSQLHFAPRPPLAKQKTAESMGKGKSRSPLRNEIDSDSVSSGSEDKKRERSKSSSRHSANSAQPPPSEYLGRPKSSGTGLETLESGSRPPTPPKPIAKLFVICCRCKYWHDLPSVMYRGMVENGGATRCPYCLHGMETSCCSGYVFSPLPLIVKAKS